MCDSKKARERDDSTENKPTAAHQLDNYYLPENLNAQEQILRWFFMMTKNSTDHELFDLSVLAHSKCVQLLIEFYTM